MTHQPPWDQLVSEYTSALRKYSRPDGSNTHAAAINIIDNFARPDGPYEDAEKLRHIRAIVTAAVAVEAERGGAK